MPSSPFSSRRMTRGVAPVMRRVAASLFVAAVVFVVSASSPLAAGASTNDLPTPAVTSQLLVGPNAAPNGPTVLTSAFAMSPRFTLTGTRRFGESPVLYDDQRGAFSGFFDFDSFIVESPSLVGMDDSEFVFARGGDNQVYFARFTKGVTSGLQLVPGLKVASRVTAVSNEFSISVFARGQDNRGYVNVLSVRDGQWTGWSALGSQTLASDLSPVQFGISTAQFGVESRPLVFARGTDNAAYVTRAGSSSGWTNLGGTLRGNITPAVVERRAAGALLQSADIGDRAVFVLARGSDNTLIVNRAVDELRQIPRFSGFRRVDGSPSLNSDIGAPAFTAGNQVTLVVRAGSDQALFANTINYDGSDQGFVFLGGFLTSNPTVIHPVNQQTRRLDSAVTEVYARAGDNALWFNRRGTDGRWGGYTRLGGQLGSPLGG